MDRWAGVVGVPLSRGGPLFRVAASLILKPAKTLVVRPNPCSFLVSFPLQTLACLASRDQSLNSPTAAGSTRERYPLHGRPPPRHRRSSEKLSDAAHLSRVLAGKLSEDTNAWVVDASCFAGPFAIYRELIPSVDAAGDPKGYDPTGFPAAGGIASILAHGIDEIQNKISGCSSKDLVFNQRPAASLSSYCPRTIILGFSKGGVVVNQLVTELSCWASESVKNSVDVSWPNPSHVTRGLLVPTSTRDILSSISEFHYVDVGLNCAGAYITDHTVIKEIANYVLCTDKNLRFVLHGTPRQWSDLNRSWIQKEKDIMLQLLRDEAQRSEGRLLPYEKKYFDGKPRSLLMHFEILEAMDIS